MHWAVTFFVFLHASKLLANCSDAQNRDKMSNAPLGTTLNEFLRQKIADIGTYPAEMNKLLRSALKDQLNFKLQVLPKDEPEWKENYFVDPATIQQTDDKEEVENSPLYARIKSDFITLRSRIFDLFKMIKELRKTSPNYKMDSWFHLQSQVGLAYYSDPYTSGNSLAVILSAKMYAAVYVYLGLPLDTLSDVNFDLAALKNKCDHAIQLSKNSPAESAIKPLPAKDIPEDDEYSVMLRNFSKNRSMPDRHQGSSSQPDRHQRNNNQSGTKRSEEQDNDRNSKRLRTNEHTHKPIPMDYKPLTQFLRTMLSDCGFTRKENDRGSTRNENDLEREFLLCVLQDIAKRIIESKVAIDRNDVFAISAIRLQAIVDAKVPVAWVPSECSDISTYSPVLAFLTFKINGDKVHHLSQLIFWVYKLLAKVSDQFPGIKEYELSETSTGRRRTYEVYRSSNQNFKVYYYTDNVQMGDFQMRNFIYRCATGCTLRTSSSADIENLNTILVIKAIRDLLEGNNITPANAHDFKIERAWVEQVDRLPEILSATRWAEYCDTLECFSQSKKQCGISCSIRLWEIAVALSSNYCPKEMVIVSSDRTGMVIDERLT